MLHFSMIFYFFFFFTTIGHFKTTLTDEVNDIVIGHSAMFSWKTLSPFIHVSVLWPIKPAPKHCVITK